MKFLDVTDSGNVEVSVHQLFNFIVTLSSETDSKDTWVLFSFLIRKQDMRKIEALRDENGDNLIELPLRYEVSITIPYRVHAIIVEWSHHTGMPTEIISSIYKKNLGFSPVICIKQQVNSRRYEGIYDHVYNLEKKARLAVLEILKLPSKDELLKIFKLLPLNKNQENQRKLASLFEVGIVYSIWYEYGEEIKNVKLYCKYINTILMNFNYSFLPLRDRYWNHRDNTLGRNHHHEEYELYPIDVFIKVFIFLLSSDYKNHAHQIKKEPKKMHLCRIEDKGGYRKSNCAFGLNCDNICTANSLSSSDKVKGIKKKLAKNLQSEKLFRESLPKFLKKLGERSTGRSIYSERFRFKRDHEQTMLCNNFIL